MTKFLDGPAAGVTLRMIRAPLFLRVVHNRAGKWDTLDQPDDRPQPDETIVAYRMKEDQGMVHINSRDAKGRHTGGFFAIATYGVIDPQPSDEVMRSNQRWADWAQARYAEETAERQDADQP